MLIEYKQVMKEYEKGLKALEDINLSIDKEEFVFVVGNSGAGKSTLIKLLIREAIPTTGQILFNDIDVLTYEKDQISELRRSIGVVFQDFKLLESRTVYENVAVALEVVDSSDEVIKEVVPSVLSLVGLSHKMHCYPGTLSGGEKQRVSIARALAHEPDVLVADEPTGMIDPHSSLEIMEILEKVNSLGTTILMATHNKDIVNDMKKRVIRLEKGKIISDKKRGTYE